MNYIIGAGFILEFLLVLFRPRWLVFVLLFTLIDPSRNFSLGNLELGGAINIKYYEITLLMLYGAAVIHRRRPITRCLNIALLVFVGCMTFSLVNGLMHGYGQAAFNQYRTVLSIGMMVAIPLLYDNPSQLTPVYLFYFGAVSIMAVIEFAVTKFNVPWLSDWCRSDLRFTSMISATTGSFLVMVYFYGFSVLRTIRSFKIPAVIGMVWCLLAAILCSARSVWLGLIAGSAGLITLVEFQRKIILIVFMTLFGAMLFLLAGSFYIERYNTSLLGRFKVTFNTQEGSARWRIYAWTQMLEDISYHPLVGWPLGSMPRFYVPGHHEYVAPHNEYLKIARYTGIPGLIVFIWFLATVFVPALRYLHRHIFTNHYYEMMGLILCFGYHVVTSFFTQRFTAMDISPVVWMIPGIMLLYLLTETPAESSPESSPPAAVP